MFVVRAGLADEARLERMLERPLMRVLMLPAMLLRREEYADVHR